MPSSSIISVDDLSQSDLSHIFFAARSINGLPKLEDHVLMTAFFEASTRTRLSFEIAAHRIGMRVVSFHAASSSMSKGESIKETLENLYALAPDITVARMGCAFERSLMPAQGAVINGGDGINEHPSQALLDCFTLLEHFQCDDLKQLTVLIIGDVRHSRVAHSNLKLMTRLGARVIILAPEVFRDATPLGQARTVTSFEEIEEDIDAVMCLRLQKERMDAQHMSDHDFTRVYGLTEGRLMALGAQCVVLHPGPMNLGLEIDDAVAYHKRSLILKQVRNGVFVRAAMLAFCVGALNS